MIRGAAQPTLVETLAMRERLRDTYRRRRDPIAEDRCLWRAQSFRHMVHLLPGQSVLELGCGEGGFTRQLLSVSRGQNPITAVTFDAPISFPAELAGAVEHLVARELPGPLDGRRFDFVIGLDLLDERNYGDLIRIVREHLRPGGEMLFYESNPWNPVLLLRRGLARLFGRRDPRRLVSRPGHHERIRELGFARVLVVYNDFVYAPLTRGLVWLLRNLSILFENTPFARIFAGSLLIHAQKPPQDVAGPRVSLAKHRSLLGEVSVVIPCHNEEANVRPLVTRLLDLYGDYVKEVVLVDDCSDDGTRAAIQALAARDTRLCTVLREPPNGVGRALIDGLRTVRGRWILTLDCDFKHLLPELQDLFDAAVEGWDMAVGSRFSRHSVLLNYPFAKIVANRGFHTLAQIVLWRRFRDLTNNLKLMRQEVVQSLVLRETGFAVNAEIGLEPLLAGFRVREVPISWINRTPDMGRSSFQLAHVGGAYGRVLLGLWLKRAFGIGRYRALQIRRGVQSSRRNAIPLQGSAD